MKKIILYAFLIFAAYKGLHYYYMLDHADIIKSCGVAEEARDVQANGTIDEKKAYASEFWRCIDQKQNFMHKLFLAIPEEALS